MAGHTNNAALNEAAQRERERLRKDADSKESDLLLIAYLQGREDAADKYRARITELEHKLADALQSVQSWQMEVAGRDTDIERLERELAVRDRAMEILAERHNPVYCPFPEDEHTPCVKCTLKQYSKNYQKFQVDSALAQARVELEPKPGTPITRAEALAISRRTIERAEREREELEGGSNMPETTVCPFCGDNDFDLAGLKNHLVRGDCEAYNEIDVSGFTRLSDIGSYDNLLTTAAGVEDAHKRAANSKLVFKEEN